MPGLHRVIVRTKMVKDCLSVRLASKLASTAASSRQLYYEDVIRTLNTLQTNAAVLQSYKKQGKRSRATQLQNVEDTQKYLSRAGVSMEQLDGLPVIHVAGTKGKGSTCAFCESVLRHHGLRTGFYSSPHLVAVRERIRINGLPLTQSEFSKYFWPVYNSLYMTRSHDADMPPYFMFLTVLAFKVFLAEKVDVAIVEVGIGGEYDCTNVLRQVDVVGITSLGLDHIPLLGRSLEDIAWQKAGILKPGAQAFTVTQPPSALSVLCERAVERQCVLRQAPPLEAYTWSGNVQLRWASEAMMLNASLALQLSQAFLQRHLTAPHAGAVQNSAQSPDCAPAFTVSAQTLEGLRAASWPGRLQLLRRERVLYCLDGAHTPESLQMCAQWFMRQGRCEKRLLVFNATGDRDVSLLFQPLFSCHFDVAIFCPNITETCSDNASDQKNCKVTRESQCEASRAHQECWERLHTEGGPRARSCFLPCVTDVLSFLDQEAQGKREVHVLVTGSLHLVGCVLRLLDPDLSAPSHHVLS